ncbi:MAG: hypothetical protein ACRENB_17180 [Gemmatimonadales bacterium]
MITDRRALILLAAVLAGCGSRPGVTSGPTVGGPPPKVPGTGLGAGTGEAWFYKLPTATRYRITRIDSLTMGEGPMARPQVTGKVALVTARAQASSRVLVSLDSVAPTPGRRLSEASIDSARGLRWDFVVSRTGRTQPLKGSVASVLAEQLGQVIGLLFQQLPNTGVRAGTTWTDTERVDLRIDAFAATEVVKRNATARPGDMVSVPAVLVVDVQAELSRTGVAVQGGRQLRLQGAGRRTASYRLGAAGWPVQVRARDSLSLFVTTPEGAVVPVQWITRMVVESDGARR